MVINKAAAAEREEELGKALRRVAGGRDSGEGEERDCGFNFSWIRDERGKVFKEKKLHSFCPRRPAIRGTGE